MIRHGTNRFCVLAGVVALSSLLSCKPATVGFPKQGTLEYKIAVIGDKAVAKNYPTYNRKKYPVRITQNSDRWIFDYDLPDGMMGGGPTVEIDKKTFQVIEIYRTQ